MKILVLIGPSGSGKSEIARELHSRGVVSFVPSWTSRPRRPDEANDAIEHHFVTEAEFDRLEDEGFFISVVKLFGLPYKYAFPKELPEPGSVPAVILRAELVGLFSKYFADYVIYQLESTLDIARERILARRSPEDMGTRIEDFEKEREWGRQMADRVFETGEDIDEAIAEIERAVKEDFGG